MQYHEAAMEQPSARPQPARIDFHERIAGLDPDLTRAVIEGACCAMVTVDQNGCIVAFNRAAERMFGHPAEAVLGQLVSLLVPDRMLSDYDVCLQEAFAGGAACNPGHTHELIGLRRDGVEFPIELAISLIQPGGQVFYTAIIRDTSERRRIEAEHAARLASATEHALRLAGLAALKADFSAMVAHEMTTPLAAVRGLVDILAKGAITPDDRASLLVAIQAELGLLFRLVCDVQSVAGVERDDFSVQPRAVPVGVLLDDAVAHGKALHRHHSFTTCIGTRAMVLADPDRIGQVLRNLLSNAAKYSPDGSRIDVQAIHYAPRIRITVTDRGYGIRPDDLERVFTKFGRARDISGHRPHGLGLGLYLSRRIVRAHGNDLFVTSTPGKGSTFGFDLEVAG